MRLIPGKTKVKIELFKGITIGDIIVGIVVLGLVTLLILSTFPGKVYIASAVGAIGIFLVLRIDKLPTYRLVLNFLKYLSYPKYYWRMFSDEHLLKKNEENTPGEQWNEMFSDDIEPEEDLSLRDNIEKIISEQAEKKEEDKILKSDEATAEEKEAVIKSRKVKKEKKEKKKADKKDSSKKEKAIEDIVPFTGISDGFIEYGGEYYGTVIEIDPVEFRFFSQYRRNNAIENCFGKALRSLRSGYAANIIKIERPVLYNDYLDKEYDKLDELKASYEKGLFNEEELKSRVEIQYERINEMRKICFEQKVIQPFYYVTLFNSDKKQLTIDTKSALTFLKQAELTVRRLTSDRDIAIFLKYTNYLDFDEWDADKIDPKDYVKWAMPETVSFTSKTVTINKIVTHEMCVVGYPFYVGDSWIAGVMSIPGTKVVVKVTPMERGKSIRAIDRSLQELRGQYRTTGVDSKRLEIESHIETLSRLLITLQQENEVLLTVNIYITIYDSVRTAEGINSDAVKNTNLPNVADMKKTVRRSWQETGMKLNQMDFAQVEGFIGSQVSAYDPMLKDGRGMPTNTIAGMFPWIYARVSDKGGVRLGANDGVPVFIDFFRRDSERINSNMVIIGKSGSGKSYGTKSLLTNMASEDTKIFILDPENEYSELAHNLHGKIINVGNAKYGRLNPFQVITTLADDETGEDSLGGSFSAHLQFLEEFFRQILPDVDKEALEYLNSLVERLYLNFNISTETDLSALSAEDYPIFDDLYDIVLEDFQRTNNEYLRNILQTLMNYVSKFAGDGRNASIWNGPSSITTDENFTVFNFQSLLANRNSTIANAQMLLVLKYIDNEIIKNRDYNIKYGLNRKIIVVIDEAHVFIDTKFPVALDFMFQLAKRIRKYNGMQIVITQNIKDFVGSEEIARKSTAIINACQYSFIFGLSPNDMDDLCKLYEKAGGINETEQEQILTAPRGMAFTVMSPTSRSSFKIEVPKIMVDMFEKPDYESRYFSNEEGDANWEDFIADSRELHDYHLAERLIEDNAESDKHSKIMASELTFTEISEEEAEQLTVFEEANNNRNRNRTTSAASAKTTDAPNSSVINFTEIAPPEPEKTAKQTVQEQPIDMNAIIAMVRKEVELEMEKKLQDIAVPAAVQTEEPKIGAPIEGLYQQSSAADTGTAKEYSKDVPYQDNEYEHEEDIDESIDSDELSVPEITEPHDEDESILPGFEPAENISESESSDDESYSYESDADDYDYDTEDDEEEESSSDSSMFDNDDSEDFELKFDINAILDEQLSGYDEMSITERMEEIDVKTMEVSLEDLAEFVKLQRKNRRA